jgi:alpha-N-arabinofuranosidase
VLTVNSSGSHESATEWVEYVNGTRSGRVNPPARYWEIGNEVYSPNETGYVTADEYARRASEFAAAMKSADPAISVGAAVEVSFSQAAWMKDVYPHLLVWNERVIRGLSEDVDFLSLHFYAPFDKSLSDSTLAGVVLAAPLVFRDNVASVRDLLRTHGRQDVALAVTEYATFFGDERSLDLRTAGPESALFIALMLFEMAGQADIVLANHWSLVNNDVFGLVEIDAEGEVRRRPTQHVFAALAAQRGNRIIETAIASPSYSVAALGNVPSLQEVPYLDALGTVEDGGRKVVNLVNRSTDTALAVALNETGARLQSAIVTQWHGASAELWESGYSQSRLAADEVGSLTIVLPPFSFTTVQLDAPAAKPDN